MIKAVGRFTNITKKMDVVVLVRTPTTGLLTKSIANGIVGRGYGVQYASFNKCLEGSINSYPVELFANPTFYVHMRQSTIRIHEQLQYFFPAVGNV